MSARRTTVLVFALFSAGSIQTASGAALAFFLDGKIVTIDAPSLNENKQTPASSLSLPGTLLERLDALTVNGPYYPMRPTRFDQTIHSAAVQNNLPPLLLKSLVAIESNFDPHATSNKGAVGLTQLMPATAARLNVHDRKDARANLGGGARYLRTLLTRYDDNLDLALAAYNAGEGAVDRYGAIPPYTETRNFVRKVRELFSRSMSVAAAPSRAIDSKLDTAADQGQFR
jgi:soluble lytic murein transglycosylase-like protein